MRGFDHSYTLFSKNVLFDRETAAPLCVRRTGGWYLSEDDTNQWLWRRIYTRIHNFRVSIEDRRSVGIQPRVFALSTPIRGLAVSQIA